jgi:elongation factor Ts
MPEFSAKDVQSLRQATGAGMMDAKKALTDADGDFDAAVKLLRERGLAKAADRSDRANEQGSVAIGSTATRAALVELKCETDFVAKNEAFVDLVQKLADSVAADGPAGADAHTGAIDDAKVTLKENIELGRVAWVEAAAGQVVGTYLHRQDGRGVNAVAVVLEGGSEELAKSIGSHLAFTRAPYLSRDDVPESEVAEEREMLTNITRKEGKPEAALDKIVEGRLNGWFKERVLLEQPYIRDEKQTITQLLGDARIVRFAQVVIGA